jgi:hypothetical protein
MVMATAGEDVKAVVVVVTVMVIAITIMSTA